MSTKSGGTIETLSLFGHFHALAPNGSQYVAITDPGSSLLELAAEHNFRRVFQNDPNIGGRYSALSYFGLVPAALTGAPVHESLQNAVAAARTARENTDPAASPALWLGLAIGELAHHGRDKLTFVISEPVASFGLWVEQLVAGFARIWTPITPAFAQVAGGGDTNGMLMSLLPFALIFVIMYFLILRPQQKKVKDHAELVKNIRRGDTVVTTGGLVGKVTKVVDDDQIEFEISDGVRCGKCAR